MNLDELQSLITQRLLPDLYQYFKEKVGYLLLALTLLTIHQLHSDEPRVLMILGYVSIEQQKAALLQSQAEQCESDIQAVTVRYNDKLQSCELQVSSMIMRNHQLETALEQAVPFMAPDALLNLDDELHADDPIQPYPLKPEIESLF